MIHHRCSKLKNLNLQSNDNFLKKKTAKKQKALVFTRAFSVNSLALQLNDVDASFNERSVELPTRTDIHTKAYVTAKSIF